MTQTSLWQGNANSSDHAELCNGLYEREIRLIAQTNYHNVQAIQGRLKSLTHYINRAAYLMLQVESPLQLDIQNASWSAKQSAHMPLTGQDSSAISQWYLTNKLALGLVVPIADNNRIMLDSIDRIDVENNRFRTNTFGWFDLTKQKYERLQLLKPNKKVMTAACSGHTWNNDVKGNPVMPTLRELLLSCEINWRNFKQPSIINV